MTFFKTIVGTAMLPLLIFGAIGREEWSEKLDELDANVKTNLIGVVKETDVQTLSTLYRELLDVSTSVFRTDDDENALKLFHIQLTFFKIISSMRDWNVEAKTYKPDYRKLPSLSKEAMIALGEYKGKYDEIPQSVVREEVTRYLDEYNQMMEKYKNENALEQIQKGIKRMISQDLQRAKQNAHGRLESFIQSINSEITDEKLRRNILAPVKNMRAASQ